MKKLLQNKLFACICIAFVYFQNATVIHAEGTVTIVNPLRGPQLGLEKVDLEASLKSQWQYTKDASVSATWLWQYSALENNSLISIAKSEMHNQEHGIFLEVDKNTAEKSGVRYKGSNQWYHSDGLLLVSYDIYERQRIIDTTFEKFHKTFGYYPTSVGAWWVGSDAINYMKEKYNITAVLQCADQFETDAYSIWGTPWSIPYLPRTDNAAVPAKYYNESSKVVIMQWAPRDPNRAYGDSVTHSTFSMQDYAVKGYDLRYIEYLQNIFLKKEGDQVVFGLEGGIIPQGYEGYGKQVKQTKQWESEGKIAIQTMDTYAKEFLDNKQSLPPTTYFLTNDYEKNTDQSFWYHSDKYRLGIQNKNNKITVIDLHDYTNTPQEDFNLVPNTQKLLRINTKAIIDTVRFPSQAIELAEATKPMYLETKENTVTLKVEDRVIAEVTPDQVKLNNKTYTFNENKNHFASLKKKIWLLTKSEEIQNDLHHWKKSTIASKKKAALSLIAAYLIVGLLVTIIILIKQRNYKTALTIIIVIISIPSIYLYKKLTTPESFKLLEYEAESLQQMNVTTGKIAYLAPSSNLEYRAIRPFFYAKPEIAQRITGRKWEYLYRVEGRSLRATLEKNTVLIVPRYLGQDIYQTEELDIGLQKIMDNGQIALYLKK